ncbi:13945_t:CDS:2, partial [Racocetra persica]
VAEMLKQQIIYDIAVELSTICDGIGDNSSLKDEEVYDANFGSNDSDVDSNINCNDTNPNINCSDVNPNSDTIDEMLHNGLNTTAIGDVGNENEIIFYMFPVKQDTPLGEWMLDTLAQLYAFIKCLRSGLHQSILPNRRTAKMQQQSMDLLHRIGDATIIDNDLLLDPSVSSLKKASSDSINDVVNSNNIPDNLAPTAPVSIQNVQNDELTAIQLILSPIGPSASRSRIPYKKLDPIRRKTIKSFKQGILDLSRKDLRRKAMETIFKPFEQLADNTLYGRNLRKKDDGLVGGVKNIIIQYPKYIQQKEAERQKVIDIEDMIE